MRKKTGKPLGMILVVIGGILLNLLGRYVASALSLPLWLDVVGSCVAAYYAGPVGGAIAGAAHNLLTGIVSPVSAAYALTSAVVGLLFGWCARRGYLERFSTAMLSSFLLGLFSVAVSTPLCLVFRGGRSGNMWGDALFDMLDWYGLPTPLCAVAGEALVEIVDKQVCVGLAFCIIRGVRYWQSKRPGRRQAAAVLLLALTLPLLPAPAAQATETNRLFGYTEFVYDLASGMSSSEANAIEETPDGYIWIGSYAGLTRYDGTDFEFIHVSGIASVTALLTDRDGRLWVGTNDGGVARYENGRFTFFTVDNGLSANSIRSFAQGEDGVMYVGTTDKVCAIDAGDHLEVLPWDVAYVKSMLVYEDAVIGATNSGELFAVSDGKTQILKRGDGTYYTCVAATDRGLLAGTSGQKAAFLKLDGGALSVTEEFDAGDLSYLTWIGADSEDRIWLCAYNGMGYLEGDSVRLVRYDGFDDSVEYAHEDYQGNLWFASSRCGVMKLSRNRFTDLFASAGVEPAVVNAVTEYRGRYYCGTDSGLVILEKGSLERVEDELTRRLDGVRIRSLMVDSRNDLWLCTYSTEGLLRYDGQSVTVYNAQGGAVCDRFRCAAELPDGAIAAGASEGINFIRDGEIVGCLTQADGLANPQILCLLALEDGSLLAGTDGAGIYRIRDGEIVERITTENGLTSDVILRITAYEDGYFVVTSNCLCWLGGDGAIRALEEFPYFNNFDLLVYQGTAYVLSSSGIYAVDAAGLKQGRVERYDLYNPGSGLLGDLTSNAWRYVDGDGTLFFCCNDGVTSFSLDRGISEGSYKFGLASLTGDGLEIHPDESGVYTVPAGVKHIVIKPSLRNYALASVKLRFYIEGMDEAPAVVSQSNLEPIQISNLSHGSYPIHLQILSEDGGSMIQEQVLTLYKAPQVWENTWYIVYLLLVGVWLVAFITWCVIMLVNISRRKKELEIRRRELEDTVALQTREIREQAAQKDRFQWSVIEGMACLIEDRDGSTGLHVVNTRQYVSVIARELLRRGLHPEIVDRTFVDYLIRVAPLHDVGKIRISDVILNKPGRFTPEEFEQMKRHAAYGGEVVERILGQEADPLMRQMAKDVATCHHERWDGKGYPAGLKGEEIPLSGRIMAVADVFDALVAKRVYKGAMGTDEAFSLIREEAGTHFDPEIVEIFWECRDEVVSYVRSAADTPREASAPARTEAPLQAAVGGR